VQSIAPLPACQLTFANVASSLQTELARRAPTCDGGFRPTD
jgi:hypothetical protein